MNFGEHLTIDGYGGNFEKLNDKELVLKSLEELVEKLGMHKLSEPMVSWAEGNDNKDPGGWSGFIMIIESHISMHTFPARGFISADVYTCQNGLNTALIIDYFKDQFMLKEVETNFIKRGTKYPESNL